MIMKLYEETRYYSDGKKIAYETLFYDAKKKGIPPMRKITASGIDIDIRPLTRKEVRALKASGVNLLKIDHENPDAAIDAVLALLFDDGMLLTIDEMPYQDASKIFVAAMKETFGAPDEEKN